MLFVTSGKYARYLKDLRTQTFKKVKSCKVLGIYLGSAQSGRAVAMNWLARDDKEGP